MRAKASRKPAETDFKLDCYPPRSRPPKAAHGQIFPSLRAVLCSESDSLFFVPSPTVDWHRRAGRVKDAVLPHLA